jgi:outer membrane protein
MSRLRLFVLVAAVAVTTCSLVGAQTRVSPSLTLDEVVAYALQHNPLLVSSQQGVAVAQAGVRQARSSYAPQLTLEGTAGTSGSSGGSGFSATQSNNNAVDLVLGMTFWRSGRSASVAQSRANVQVAAASYVDRRLSVAQSVAQDYYAVLAATELLGVAKAGVESAEQHRVQVQKQVEAGTVAPVELHTVDDDLAQARLSLIDARGTVQTALATLKADMGLAYTADLQLAPAIMGAEAKTPTAAEAVDLALRTRPDLRSQEALVTTREAAVRVAKAAHGPVLEVGAQAAAGSAEHSDDNSSWQLTAGISWPLADGGYTAAGVDIAQSNLISAEADQQTAINQATLEVENALTDLQTASERIAASEQALAAAQARLTAAEAKYREGLAILIEVTDARKALTSAEADLVRARFSYQAGQVTLQRAMGTLPLPAEETVQK